MLDTSTEVTLKLRRATLKDIEPMLRLINSYAAERIMLPRTEFEMAENIRDFIVAFRNDLLIGCGALHFYSPFSAEVRSLAVEPQQKSGGVGRAIVESLEQEAREHDLANVFAFTYVPGFFRKLGFEEVDRAELPLKAWKDCLKCPKFQCCDEIAMLKTLRSAPEAPSAPTSLFHSLGLSNLNRDLFQIPITKP